MKRMLKYMVVAAAVLITVAGGVCLAQDGSTEKGRGARNKKGATEQQEQVKKQKMTVEEHRAAMMEFFVEGGDTVYVGKSLPAARVFGRIGKQKGKDWRQYYKLVYNFSKVYPYAKEAKGILENVDSTLTAEGWKRGKKEKYIDEMVRRLFEAYEEPLRGVTITQGALLIRLINRETGITPYSIIKDYKNGMAAGFWQGVGKLYSINLKDPYDPDGTDAETEELVILWEIGEFSAVYYSLFGEYPVIPEVKKGFGR